MTTLHKPGTPEAIAAGCTCPVIDNHHGEGVPDGKGGHLWWYNIGCPYHWRDDDGREVVTPCPTPSTTA